MLVKNGDEPHGTIRKKNHPKHKSKKKGQNSIVNICI